MDAKHPSPAIIPATTDAVQLIELAVDAAVEFIRSNDSIEAEQIAVDMLCAMLHMDATPARDLLDAALDA